MVIDTPPYTVPYKPTVHSIKFFEWLRIFGSDNDNKTAQAHYMMMDNTFNPKFKNKQVICTRGLGKTTLNSFYLPLYCSIMETVEGIAKDITFIIIASATEEQAKTIGKGIVDRYWKSEEMQKYLSIHKAIDSEVIFNRLNKPLRKVKGKIVYEKVHILLKSSGQQVRGIQRGGKRPQVIIADDILKTDMILSKSERDKVAQWFASDVVPAVDPNNHSIIVVGTPIHEDDVLSKLKKAKTWITLELPIAENYSPDMEEKDLHSAWKDRFTKEYIDNTYESMTALYGSSAFWRECMLKVVDKDSVIFDSSKLRNYSYLEMRPQFKAYSIYTAVDFAISTSSSADKTVITTIALNHQYDWFLIDIRSGRWNPSETIDNLFEVNAKYNPIEVGIETVAFQKSMSHFITKEMQLRNVFFRITELKNTNRKIERIKGLEPIIKMGKMYLPIDKDLSDIEELKHQISMTTNEGVKAKHDDHLDCLSNMLQLGLTAGSKGTEFYGNHANPVYDDELEYTSSYRNSVVF